MSSSPSKRKRNLISLILGITWGVAVICLAFTRSIKPGITTVAVALAGLGLILKSYHIFTLGG